LANIWGKATPLTTASGLFVDAVAAFSVAFVVASLAGAAWGIRPILAVRTAISSFSFIAIPGYQQGQIRFKEFR
jgi:hypothetical protein